MEKTRILYGVISVVTAFVMLSIVIVTLPSADYAGSISSAIFFAILTVISAMAGIHFFYEAGAYRIPSETSSITNQVEPGVLYSFSGKVVLTGKTGKADEVPVVVFVQEVEHSDTIRIARIKKSEYDSIAGTFIVSKSGRVCKVAQA